MKKIFISVMTFVLLASILTTVAFAEDYSAKSDAELFEAFNAIRAELTSRGFKAENKKVIYDSNNIQVYLNGEIAIEDTWMGLYLKVPIVIVNNTEKSMCLQMRNSSVNGWACDTSFSPDVPAGKKAKDDLEFELKDTDLEKIEDFEDVEFCFNIFETNNWFGETVVSDPIHIFAE